MSGDTFFSTKDAAGRTLQIRHSIKAGNVEIDRAYYTYDPLGRPTVKDTTHGSFTYVYDNLNQLSSENHPLLGLTTWTYDAACRRTLQTTPSAITTYTYDSADELLRLPLAS